MLVQAGEGSCCAVTKECKSNKKSDCEKIFLVYDKDPGNQIITHEFTLRAELTL